MDLIPLYVTASLLAAVATAMGVSRFRAVSDADSERVVTLDGLRGYLAICVFIHHATIWPEFLRTGIWQLPASRLLTNLGQASVAMFFMLTSFLFFSRMLDRQRPVDWLRLRSLRFPIPAPGAAVFRLYRASVCADLHFFGRRTGRGGGPCPAARRALAGVHNVRGARHQPGAEHLRRTPPS